LSSHNSLIYTEINRFGWVNASYVYGMQLLPMHMRRALGSVTTYDVYLKATGAFESDYESNESATPETLSSPHPASPVADD
jgi:hypothetical protein